MKLRIACTAAIVIAGVANYAIPAIGLVPPLLLHNETGHSVPFGYYRLAPAAVIERGAFVAVRNPKHFQNFWLMKRVMGAAGDRYCWQPEHKTHRLNERLMPAPDPTALALGIPVWSECRVLADDEIVGYGMSDDSYDARYFGPVKVADLWGVYKPVSWLNRSY